MNDSLIRTFCESPRRPLIVASVTTLFALGLALPLADELYTKKTHCDALTVQLENARLTEAGLPALEKRVAEVTADLSGLEVRAVGEESVAAFRSRLVDIVRTSGCQIRRVEVGTKTVRPWLESDHALETEPKTGSAKTPFMLERRSIVLAVDGAMSEVHKLLESLEAEGVLAHPKSLRLQPASRGGQSATMELELWLFDLSRNRA